MTPLFTIHAGEYVVAHYIEKKFPRVNIWVPAKDTGVDLLITDTKNKHSISVQVKTSRDFLVTQAGEDFQNLCSSGWWTFNRQKIQTSSAEYWILLIVRPRSKHDFIIIKPTDLLRQLDKIHANLDRIQSYLLVTAKGQCWETRGLKISEKRSISEGQFPSDSPRNFSRYLENWTAIEALNAGSA